MINRRAFMGLVAAGSALPWRARASELPRERLPQLPTGTPGLLMAGSHSAMAERWSPILPTALGRGWACQPAKRARHRGAGRGDGANLFDSQFASDGMMALAAPGQALVSSLCGDPRIHFDYSRWLPLLLSLTVPIVIGRTQLHRSLGSFMRDRPVRIAVSTLTGIELPTVLAMTLFGLRPIPVTGLATPQAAAAALRDNQVDVIQITDPLGTPETAALTSTLAQAGCPALFALTDRPGTVSLPGQTIMNMEDRLRQDARSALNSLLHAALRPLAGAAGVDLALVLPMLTSSATLARWRAATTQALHDGTLQATMHDAGRTLLTGTDATEALRQISGDTSSIMTLRRWLAANLPTWRLG